MGRRHCRTNGCMSQRKIEWQQERQGNVHSQRFSIKEMNWLWENFSSIIKLTAISSVLSIVITENLHLKMLDMKITFLHGDIEEDIYIVQPESFYISCKENYVYKHKKKEKRKKPRTV